jgi:hypothetical protein
MNGNGIFTTEVTGTTETTVTREIRVQSAHTVSKRILKGKHCESSAPDEAASVSSV